MTTCARCRPMTICCCIHEMTQPEAAAEWEYRRSERLGINLGTEQGSFSDYDQAESEIPELLRIKRKPDKK